SATWEGNPRSRPSARRLAPARRCRRHPARVATVGALTGQTGLGIAPLTAMTAGKLLVIIQPTGDTPDTPALALLTVLYALLYTLYPVPWERPNDRHYYVDGRQQYVAQYVAHVKTQTGTVQANA